MLEGFISNAIRACGLHCEVFNYKLDLFNCWTPLFSTFFCFIKLFSYDFPISYTFGGIDWFILLFYYLLKIFRGYSDHPLNFLGLFYAVFFFLIVWTEVCQFYCSFEQTLGFLLLFFSVYFSPCSRLHLLSMSRTVLSNFLSVNIFLLFFFLIIDLWGPPQRPPISSFPSQRPASGQGWHLATDFKLGSIIVREHVLYDLTLLNLLRFVLRSRGSKKEKKRKGPGPHDPPGGHAPSTGRYPTRPHLLKFLPPSIVPPWGLCLQHRTSGGHSRSK